MLMFCMTGVCCASINAQDRPVENYLQKTGDYADIYNGKMEANYSPLLYKSLPYYYSSNFTDASIIYRNNYYPNQKVRLDLFKEQLILLPAEKQFGIVLSSQNLQKVYMYNKTFVWLDPSKESGIKAGFYMQLLDKEILQLFCKQSFNIQQEIVTDASTNKAVAYTFSSSQRYYLLYKERYYMVKNKNSFSKLFPQYKKQINHFAKERKLDFKYNADESFASLAGYCEELITSTSKQ